MASSFAGWLLNNIAKARRWRGNTGPGGGDPLGHDWEGGVDIPLPAGTPIYALATGPLMGAGTFTMGAGGFGHGVVTQNVAGVGQVYYQHIDLAPGIPHCKSGNCGGYVVHAGQLIGHSTGAIGEVEVGINATWGGIWGTNRNNALWVSDPRAQLKALASGTTGGTIGGNVSTGCVPCGALGPCCPPKVCIGSAAGIDAQCVDQAAAGVVGNPSSVILPDWLLHPDWFRVLKFIGGILCLGIGLGVLFFPQAEKLVGDAAKVAAV